VDQSATSTSNGPLASAGLNFEGLGNGFPNFSVNSAPPDTNGTVGATQYVQWVNESFAVFDKATGNILVGPIPGNQLFQALGSSHPCAVNNDGDPIAQYDQQHRWILTQFSVTGGSIRGIGVHRHLQNQRCTEPSPSRLPAAELQRLSQVWCMERHLLRHL
jgi:hypothetical protein